MRGRRCEVPWDERSFSSRERRWARVIARRVMDTGPWLLGAIAVSGGLAVADAPRVVLVGGVGLFVLAAGVWWSELVSSLSYDRAAHQVWIARRDEGGEAARALSLRWLRWAFVWPWRWTDRERSQALAAYRALFVGAACREVGDRGARCCV